MMKQQTQIRITRFALITLAIVCAQWFASAACAAPNGRERILIDSGWRFHLGDMNRDSNSSAAITEWLWINGAGDEAQGATYAAAAYTPDTMWKRAAVGEDTFHGRSGFAWYRALLPALPGPHRVLHFDSVDDKATVFVNGKRLLHHEGWNEEFDVPLDAVWQENAPNVVAVLVENTNGAGGIGAAAVTKGEAQMDTGPAAPDFNDSDWRAVHLPHDFVVEGTFTPKADASHGSLPTDVGWYRKTFEVPASDKGRRLWLDFDGVYRNSNVWLNGKLLGNHKSGYTGFRYDVTDIVNYGGKNTIAVRADARAQEGWWYEGGGIYRHVWLNKANPVHIAPDGVFVTSTVESNGTATIRARAELDTQPAQPSEYVMIAEVQTDGGKTLLSKSGKFFRRSQRPHRGKLRVFAAHPTTLVRRDAHAVQTRDAHSAERQNRRHDGNPLRHPHPPVRCNRGFFLNDKPVKIQGTCNHQDFAGVGIAMPDSLLEWRVKKLKAMGSNAYRMSHNPPTAELLDACDRLGMLVMDEARHLGDVYTPKTPRGAPASDLSDLREMVLRDRNHPSIIMWSMCNEEPLQGTEDGARIFKAMKEATLALDPTRPITCAMNGGWGQGITFVEDLQGINYSPRRV